MKPYFTYGTQASDRDLVTSTTTYAGQHKRYFSSLDAEVFIGGERILDIARIDFTYEEKKMPIYGFNSFIPSRVIVGQKIISGSFVINFTETGYIAKLLEKIDSSKIANPWDRIGISCDIYNSAMFKKSFDILIGYGGYDIPEEFSYNATYQILQGVYITGFQQILDTSGEPVYEVYSFLARNLDFTSYNPNLGVEPSPIKPDQGKGKGGEFIETEEDKINFNIGYTNKHTLPRIELVPNTPDDIKITHAKVTISDNQINMSKTYTLIKSQQTWLVNIESKDFEQFSKKNGVNVYVELNYEYNNSLKTINKNAKMYKTL